jgi:glycosyltransferase involved in cell wall biosynthesis
MPESQNEQKARSRPHDVALVIHSLGGGGSERVLTTLANAWATAELRVCIITFSDGNTDRYALHHKITRLFLNHPKHSKSLKFSRTLLNPVKQSKLRVLLALCYGIRQTRLLRKSLRTADAPVVLAFLTATNIMTILASTGLDSRVVVSERTDPSMQSLDWPWGILRRWLYRYADVVTANSHGALQSLQKFVPQSKLHFVPNPVKFPAASICESSRTKTILTVGRLSHVKAQDVLLEAYALVVTKKSGWKLTVVGEGPKKQDLYDQASALGLLDHIKWVGWTSEIDRYYKTSRIFVLPSRYEGTPNALLEAMSFGLPVIVTDASPGPLEHVVDGKTGLVVPTEDAHRLANAILKLTENQELRNRLGTAARERIAEFDQDVLKGEWASALGLSLHTGKRPHRC